MDEQGLIARFLTYAGGWMEIDTTIRITDVVLAVVGSILIPALYALIANLVETRKALIKLELLIFGTHEDPTTGVLPSMATLKREVLKHGHRLIVLELENGIKVNERT